MKHASWVDLGEIQLAAAIFFAYETIFDHQIEDEFLGVYGNTATLYLFQIIEDGMEGKSSILPLFHISNPLLPAGRFGRQTSMP